jgi:ABC-2 type transport system permease protein
MLDRFLAIAVNTFHETIRQPIFNILMWVAIFWVAFVSPSLAAFTLSIGDDIKIMKDVGLATLLLYGLLAAVFSASSVITREIESQTVLTVVSKPVSRPVFITGKYVGVSLAMLLAFLTVSIAFFLAVRHGTMDTAADQFDLPVWTFGGGAIAIALVVATFGNYFYGWNFLSALFFGLLIGAAVALGLVLFIDENWAFQAPWTDFGDLQLLYAVILIFSGVLVLTSFAIAFSTRFGQLVTLLLSAGVLMVGLLSDWMFGQVQDQALLFDLLYRVVPNFQFFWVGDLLTQEQEIPVTMVTRVVGYAGLYTLGVLGLGVALFETREVG